MYSVYISILGGLELCLGS